MAGQDPKILKILSRITEPTEGYAEMKERTGSLLEIGVFGFPRPSDEASLAESLPVFRPVENSYPESH
jgi:hypothetical protein